MTFRSQELLLKVKGPCGHPKPSTGEERVQDEKDTRKRAKKTKGGMQGRGGTLMMSE